MPFAITGTFQCRPELTWARLIGSNLSAVAVAMMTRTESATLNVAGPDRVTLRAVCTSLGELVGRPPVFQVEEAESVCWIADTSAAER